ncbi:MAG: hypothetical protein IQL11_15530, partial [Bacteroidales bacterium]|nr:hypothetical protein [Bacteroidales bacterium]
LYIDDIETNVEAAESAGMKGLTTNGAQDISAMLEKVLNLSSGLK